MNCCVTSKDEEFTSFILLSLDLKRIQRLMVRVKCSFKMYIKKICNCKNIWSLIFLEMDHYIDIYNCSLCVQMNDSLSWLLANVWLFIKSRPFQYSCYFNQTSEKFKNKDVHLYVHCTYIISYPVVHSLINSECLYLTRIYSIQCTHRSTVHKCYQFERWWSLALAHSVFNIRLFFYGNWELWDILSSSWCT